MPPSVTHYDLLAVAPTATADEIKRAWARKMREHPPDKDPAGNQAINEAKQTLLDPLARKQYDTLLLHGGAIREALARAFAAAEADNHAVAAAAYREALALDPESHPVRNLLGLATKRAGDVQKAVQILRGLVERAPDVALYRHNLGTMLWELDGPGTDRRIEESIQHLRQAVALEPHDADYHVALAHGLRRARQFAEAEREIEFALFTDGRLDLQDLDTLFELPVLRVCAGELPKIKVDAERILGVVADLGDEAKSHCAYRFARMAAELLEIKAYEAAHRCADAAVVCDRTDNELKELQKTCKRLAKLEDEFERMQHDAALPAPIKGAMGARSLLELGTLDLDEAKTHYSRATSNIGEMTNAAVAAALELAKKRYPATYRLGREDYDQWHARARDAMARAAAPPPQAPVARPSTSTPPASGGCLIPTCLALVGVVALVGSVIQFVSG